MKNKDLPKTEHVGSKGGLSSPESVPLVLRAPADVYSFSLVLLTVLAVIFVLHWARAFFIPLMLGVPIIMIIKAICDRVEDLYPIGELLGE